jgi:RHS repeat-associated protein
MTRRRALLLGLALVVCWPARGLAQTTTVVEYYHTDVLGSVRVVTNAQGQVLARHDFTPFGEELHPPSPPMDRKLFTGQEHDLETGQDYFHARQMMAEIARFGAFDPLSTTPATRGDAQDFNGYAYARNNPLKFVDPTGLSIWSWLQGLFGGGEESAPSYVPGGMPTFRVETVAYLSDDPPPDQADFWIAMRGGGLEVDPNQRESQPVAPSVALARMSGFASGAFAGLGASIDAAIPFADPLESLGLYDPLTPGLQFSRRVGGWSVNMLTTYGLTRLLAAGAETIPFLRVLNHNPYLRIGSGRMPGGRVPRISIGTTTATGGTAAPSIWNHLDLRFWGF